MNLNAKYWNNRYLEGNIPWDAGQATKPLSEYFEKISDKNARILIPGAGNAHEAAYLFQLGFKNVVVCDWAEAPLQTFAEKYPDFPKKQLVCEDFFSLDEKYDYIVEQTFFCALSPDQRKAYVRQMFHLLKPKGILVGILFGIEFDRPGPPFGGSKEEYLELFGTHFEVLHMKDCENSIKPRMGSELFIELRKANSVDKRN